MCLFLPSSFNRRNAAHRYIATAAVTLGLVGAALNQPPALAQSTASSNAQAASPLATMRVDHVMVGVDDFDGMIRWYVDKLGFLEEKRWTVEGLAGINLAYLIGPGDFRIEFIGGGKGPRTPVPATFPQHFTMRGFQHLCFWVDDVDAAMAELRRRGVPVFVPAEDYPVGAERRVAFIQDPEGNVIEFAGPLRGAR